MKSIQSLSVASILFVTLNLTGCDDDDDNVVVVPTPVPLPSTPPELVVPTQYEFASRGDANASSVSYSGQTIRHILINDLNSYINIGLQEAIDNNDFVAATKENIIENFDFYFRFKTKGDSTVAIRTSTTPNSLQASYGDISTDKDLREKIAGNDEVGQTEDWSAGLIGWTTTEGSAVTPEGLVDIFFSELADNVLDAVGGTVRQDPLGNAISSVYVSTNGRDLKQLIQKFLLGSVAFSQAADDYLDNDVDGKGLLSDHTTLVEGKSYTALEHQWDEGFGYYGAAINQAEYTDEEIASRGGRADFQGVNDTDGDGAINFLYEYNFGNSVNSAKRDLGSSDTATTDFTKVILEAFLTGRAIISHAESSLTEEQLADLVAQRNIVINNWEMVIVATIVHYINDSLQDIRKFGTPEESFADYAKHWSELKGFALGLQFNPFMKLTKEEFAVIHDQIGTQPVLSNAPQADRDAFVDNLLAARAKFAEVYAIDPSNVGDENGENGW
ncbi:MAG: DUF4856 domain-containing protein [Pseudomonadota bacterium]